MTAFHEELRPLVGVKKACTLLGRVRSSYYRARGPVATREPVPRASEPNALSEAELAQVLALLCKDLHADSSVAQVYAETLDEGMRGSLYLENFALYFSGILASATSAASARA